MKLKVNNRKKQILSWPFLISGMYLLLQAIALDLSDDPMVLIVFLLIIPGMLLRKDLLDKENLKEFDLKYKTYFAVGAAILLLLSLSFLIFVLVNLETIKIKAYHPHIAIGFGAAMAYFGIPCEIWLFKKYRSQ